MVLFKHTFPEHVHHTYTYDFLSALWYGLFLGMTLPFAGVVARKLGVTEVGVAWIAGAPYLGSLFACYCGHTAQGDKKKWSYLSTIFISSIFFFILGILTVPLCVIVLIISAALFTVYLGRPAYAGIMSLVYPEHVRGKLMGLVKVAYSIGVIIASFLAGKFLDQYGYRVVFPLASIFGLIAVYLFNKILIPQELHAVDKEPFHIRRMLQILKKDSIFRNFQIAYYLFGFGNILILPLYNLFMVDILHLSNFEVGKIFMVSSVAGTLGLFFWGYAIDRYGASCLIPFSIFSMGVTPLFYALAQNTFWLYGAAVFWGFGLWSIDLLVLSSMIATIAPKNLVQYTGIHYSLMGTRGLIAPFLGIALASLLGLRGALYVGAGCMLFGGLLLWRQH